MPTVTTAQDVLELFNVTRRMNEKYDRWLMRRQAVVEHVMAHRAQVVYRVRPSEVEAVCRRTAQDRRLHALGEVKRKDAESVADIVNWRPDFAFTHVFHFALEAMDGVPDWQEFREFSQNDPRARGMLWIPAQEKIAELISSGTNSRLAHDSMQWRVGNAYYSFIREIYTVSYLRAAGYDLRVHPLADALFRVDAWLGRTLMSLYVRNRKFQDGLNGRKDSPEWLLEAAGATFQYESFKLPRASKFGEVLLPGKEKLEAAIRRFEELGLNCSPSLTNDAPSPL